MSDETRVALEPVLEREALLDVEKVDVVVVAAGGQPLAVGAELYGVDVLGQGVVLYPLLKRIREVHARVPVAVPDADPFFVRAPADVPSRVGQLSSFQDDPLLSVPDVQNCVLSDSREDTLLERVRPQPTDLSVVTGHHTLELRVSGAVVPHVQEHPPLVSDDDLLVLSRQQSLVISLLDDLLIIQDDYVHDALVRRDGFLLLALGPLRSPRNGLLLLLLGLFGRLGSPALARELSPRQSHVVSVQELALGVTPNLQLSVASSRVQLVAFGGWGEAGDPRGVLSNGAVRLDGGRDGGASPNQNVADVSSSQEAGSVHGPRGARELPHFAGRHTLPVREHLHAALRVVRALLVGLKVEEPQELPLGNTNEGD
mmetsp:Transcript_4955/g.9145  ORF Transcript_4955/g.9145 Transcript_4955/m.9145 type:complete len:371 (-) Transcript_4955:2785-3897(-)